MHRCICINFSQKREFLSPSVIANVLCKEMKIGKKNLKNTLYIISIFHFILLLLNLQSCASINGKTTNLPEAASKLKPHRGLGTRLPSS